MDKFICVHGHFYQPPRENAWLEAVELQDSAYPYHDWNERITAECYATMATSRLLDERGRIRDITNNYAKISFNFGPTLLAWLERHAPMVYGAILEADRESRRRFSGHGAAIAQPYNHMIMPLANRRDKETQIVWGILDFEHRFQRRPEGMWLPETAVDVETLESMAEHEIGFTILAPRQAKQTRLLNGGDWQAVDGGRIDPSRPYLARLPSGRSIALFFYDDPISRAVAFEGLLSDGERFARRLMDGFDDKRQEPQLVHIATDGESYGHHHYKGNMALAFALYAIEHRQLARLTIYGEYLALHPPQREVEIFEKTSWSCVHGVERWWRDCGCNSGGHPNWHQAWRTPLREALDWLRDTLAPAYEEKMKALGCNRPWEVRDDYIRVVLNRDHGAVDAFLTERASQSLSDDDKILAIQLLELQRHAMLMFTSCGWFFDDISGIETVQVIQFASRALQLAKASFGDGLEPRFLQLLEKAPSNLREHRDGRRIYEKFIKPAMVNLYTVGAHYAMRSLFEEYPEQASVNCYSVERSFFRALSVGRAKLSMGRVRITSAITWKSADLCFGAIHWGDHNISCCISPCAEKAPAEPFIKEVFDVFSRAEFPTALLLLEKTIGASTYSLRHLFRDEQRRILQIVLESNLSHAEAVYRQVYDTNAPLLLFLKDLNVPAPRALAAAAEYLLNAAIRRAFESHVFDLNDVRKLLDATTMHGVTLDAAFLEMPIRRCMERAAENFRLRPDDSDTLQQLDAIAGLLPDFSFEINLRTVQNIFFHIQKEVGPQIKKKAGRRDKKAREWIAVFNGLGQKIGMKTES